MTEVMSRRKLDKNDTLDININGKWVQTYWYLEGKITVDGRSEFGIIRKIARGKRAFQKKKRFIYYGHVMELDTREFIFENTRKECDGMRTWNLNIECNRKMKTRSIRETCCYRKTLEICDGLINEMVLKKYYGRIAISENRKKI